MVLLCPSCLNCLFLTNFTGAFAGRSAGRCPDGRSSAKRANLDSETSASPQGKADSTFPSFLYVLEFENNNRLLIRNLSSL